MFISYFVIIFRFYIISLLINIFQPSNQLQANQFYPMARNSSLYFIRHHDLYLCHKRANSWQTVSRQQHSLGTREKICQADSSSFVLTLLPAIVRKWLLFIAKIHSIHVLDLIIIILLFDNNNVIISQKISNLQTSLSTRFLNLKYLNSLQFKKW